MKFVPHVLLLVISCSSDFLLFSSSSSICVYDLQVPYAEKNHKPRCEKNKPCTLCIGLDDGDVTARNCWGETALHNACRNPELIESLLKRGADSNEQSCSGKTPLWECVIPRKHDSLDEERNRTNAAELLLKQGADVHPRNRLDATLLHFAASWGNRALTQLLIVHKAEINAKDIHGYTPFDRALYWLAFKLNAIEKKKPFSLTDESKCQARNRYTLQFTKARKWIYAAS